jgi:hypothetical protein
MINGAKGADRMTEALEDILLEVKDRVGGHHAESAGEAQRLDAEMGTSLRRAVTRCAKDEAFAPSW